VRLTAQSRTRLATGLPPELLQGPGYTASRFVEVASTPHHGASRHPMIRMPDPFIHFQESQCSPAQVPASN
jgi:hypothetical protein